MGRCSRAGKGVEVAVSLCCRITRDMWHTLQNVWQYVAGRTRRHASSGDVERGVLKVLDMPNSSRPYSYLKSTSWPNIKLFGRAATVAR